MVEKDVKNGKDEAFVNKCIVTMAIDKSGLSRLSIAERLGVGLYQVLAWEKGTPMPFNKAEEFAELTKIPFGVLFLPSTTPKDRIESIIFAHDPINHPSHYTSHPSGVECINITEHFNFCIGNAIKYLWRAGLKEGSSDLQDLKKAEWYVKREIERRSNISSPEYA